jgi:cytochrome c oxidase assembly protein subunit 15
MYNRSLHLFAVVTAAATFLLIFVGGLVTSTGSGLSVPDWPTTYGQNMFTYPIDQWVGGIKYEHGHRLFASLVGFLTVILTVWVMLKEERKWVRWLTYFSLAAVIIQGILGGLTVLFLLPTAISVSHGMLAQSFFCVISTIALVTSRWWREGTESIPSESHRCSSISLSGRRRYGLHSTGVRCDPQTYVFRTICPRFPISIWSDLSIIIF